MTTFFPDLNVWMALSVKTHCHSEAAWKWLSMLPGSPVLIFSRYTQMGLLRLLTTAAVMGEQALNLERAWAVYDRWQHDPRIALYPEPQGLDRAFRQATANFAAERASKLIGDCYLLAFARQSEATLVTFDKALYKFARGEGQAAIVPV